VRGDLPFPEAGCCPLPGAGCEVGVSTSLYNWTRAQKSENKAPAGEPLLTEARARGIAALKLNGPNITGSHPWLAQLVGGGTALGVACINRRACGLHREVHTARKTLIGERP
jgi:hypothetical protein